jgi:cytochrome P450
VPGNSYDATTHFSWSGCPMTDALAGAASLFDLDPESVRCPYPIFAALRDEAPVVWVDQLDAFVVSRYDLIAEVLRQPDRFSSRYTTGRATDRQVARMMSELVAEDGEIGAMVERRSKFGTTPVLVRADPPQHGRQRALVNRAFSPPAIRALEPDIEVLANSLIDRFVDRGRVELVAEFAAPLPMTVIAIALGVTLDRMDDFKRWSDAIVSGFGRNGLDKAELTGIIRARSELEEYLLAVIDERELEPQRDLISQIVHARVDGERLTRHEMVEMVIQFLLAGNETTAKLISSTMLHLARDPDEASRLRSDAELIGPFIEEVLRLEPPTNGLYRIAVADCELGGVSIPFGSAIWLAYAAANRDPQHFDAPDECLMRRQATSPHLGFGLGAHFCLGAGLARAEARISVQSLLARCEEVRLAIEPDDVAYEQSYMVHGIQRLPLTFVAGA